MPPSVRTVDEWLDAFTKDDRARVLAATASSDQRWVEQALEALAQSTTSTLALALPPRPLEHRIVELEKRESGVRHRVLVELTLRNPLPFNSERIGVALDIPRTRTLERRFLSVREGDHWGVQLDLAATVARAQFVATFTRLLERGRLEEAEALLDNIPRPPDEPNALRNSDRLEQTLKSDLERARQSKEKAGAQRRPVGSHPAPNTTVDLTTEEPNGRPAKGEDGNKPRGSRPGEGEQPQPEEP